MIHTEGTDTAASNPALSDLCDAIKIKFREPHELFVVLSSCYFVIKSIKLPDARAHQDGWLEIFNVLVPKLNSSTYRGQASRNGAYHCLAEIDKLEIPTKSNNEDDYQQWRISYDPATTLFSDALIKALASYIDKKWYDDHPMPWRLRRLREPSLPRNIAQGAGSSEALPPVSVTENSAQNTPLPADDPEPERLNSPVSPSSDQREVIGGLEVESLIIVADSGEMVQTAMNMGVDRSHPLGAYVLTPTDDALY